MLRRPLESTIRTVQRFEQLRQFDCLLAKIGELREQGGTAATIAEALNAAGWRPPKRDTFNEPTVRRLLSRYRMSAGRPVWTNQLARQPGCEWTLQKASERLGIHPHTAYRWVCNGRLKARIATHGDQRIWLVQLAETELQQLKAIPAKSAAPARCRKPA